jgi:putative transposase
VDFVSDTFGASRKFRVLAVKDGCCREYLCRRSADCCAIACRVIDGLLNEEASGGKSAFYTGDIDQQNEYRQDDPTGWPVSKHPK